MKLPIVNPTHTNAWKALKEHAALMQGNSIAALFSQNENRATDMSVSTEHIYLDYSKNLVDNKALELLFELAEECGLNDAVKLMFEGEKINLTEDRAVLHTALRSPDEANPEVSETLSRMKKMADDVISGKYKGVTGKEITDVVNIGIGGSDLGPQLVCDALSSFKNHLNCHFISNVDGDQLADLLKRIQLETTLFVVVSKSFTTQETMTNAAEVRFQLISELGSESVRDHIVGVTSNTAEAVNFGIAEENILPIWDWVGGRFSLWGAAGLTICLSIGPTHFNDLLSGANKMDQHFRSTEHSMNIPVILALISIWNTNFMGATSEAIVPYSNYLGKLVPYLQQLCMESNGKNTDRSGMEINYKTGAVVWGNVGTNAQHAFFQLLHQGTQTVPVDFIVFKRSVHGNQDVHNKLLANCFAQSEALALGNKNSSEPHKNFVGNRPSNTILIDALTPQNLGALIALYEHKVFVQGQIWNINSFDQWGVELGKSVTKVHFAALEHSSDEIIVNSSSRKLINKANTD